MPAPSTRLRVTDPLDGVAGARLYEVLDASGRSVPGPRVALVGRQHGNEPVGEVVLERLAERAAGHLVRGAVVTIVANLDAARLNLRHTPQGENMNRLWDADRLAALATGDPERMNPEERRVRELAPLVLGCEAVLDLHSTSRPSPAHLLHRDDLRHAQIAARLGVARLVTGLHEHGILDGGVCADIGLRPGEPGARLGFTLEAGQHDEPDNLERAWRVVVRLLTELGLWHDPEATWTPEPYAVYDILDRFRQAPAGTPPFRFVGYAGGAAGGGRLGPPRHLESFDAIEADEVVLRRDNGEVVRAEAPFVMLMPAPTAGPGEDLYYVTQLRHGAIDARPRTDEAARNEARAVERTLDILAWDAAERGVTQVATTSRRTLDLCAELVGRTTRLPPGHPHRRITLVGRGEWGGDEADQRGALGWHASLRRALSAGVPVERIQLLRGATVGWLRDLLRGDIPASLRLRIAVHHPHTVSALVVGDPDAALSSGDLRHVGVALLVEATTVEPDGDEVRTRIARAGLVGARPELLRAAQGLLGALREEHRLAVRAGLLGPAGETASTADDDALSPPDAVAAEALCDAVIALQLRRWRAALRRSVRPVVLEHGTLGRWLSRVMAATGILDGDALKAWLVRPVAGGWDVDPARLDDALPPVHRLVPLRVLPEPIISADQVDRDNIERWLGWRRLLRESQALPGDFGRDLDLGFSRGRVQRRLARWLDDARTLAEQEPGRWLVVIAGDGLGPRSAPGEDGWALLQAHRRLLLDDRIHYLRIQHGQGSQLAWMKDFVELVSQRPPTGAPVATCWEAEHGGSVHVLLLARLEADAVADPWTLEPWRIERCAVLVNDPTVSASTLEAPAPVALFSEPGDDGRVSQELVHFGRVHCDRLLRQSSWRFTGQGGLSARLALEAAARQLLAEQIARLSAQLDLLRDVPEEEREAWVAHRVGQHDPAFARALRDAVLAGESPERASRRIWAEVQAWPGKLWDDR